MLLKFDTKATDVKKQWNHQHRLLWGNEYKTTQKILTPPWTYISYLWPRLYRQQAQINFTLNSIPEVERETRESGSRVVRKLPSPTRPQAAQVTTAAPRCPHLGSSIAVRLLSPLEPPQLFPAGPGRYLPPLPPRIPKRSGRNTPRCPHVNRLQVHPPSSQLLSAPALRLSRQDTSRAKGYFKALQKKPGISAQRWEPPLLLPARSLPQSRCRRFTVKLWKAVILNATPPPGTVQVGAGRRSSRAPAEGLARRTSELLGTGLRADPPHGPGASGLKHRRQQPLPVWPVPPVLSPLHGPSALGLPPGGERGASAAEWPLLGPSTAATKAHTERLLSSTLLAPSGGRGRPPSPASYASSGRAAATAVRPRTRWGTVESSLRSAPLRRAGASAGEGCWCDRDPGLHLCVSRLCHLWRKA